MFDRFHKAKEADELNLIPIMNLMMTLIPFLLLGAAFYHIGVIPTSLPTHTPESTGEPEKHDIITLNLTFEKDSLEIAATGSGLSEAETAALGGVFKRGPKGFDLVAIQASVLAAKEKYPKSDTMIVLPSDEVEYQDLVDVLDVTREQIIDVPGKDPIHKPLFAVTVFSKLLRPDPDVVAPDKGKDAAPKKGAK